MFTFFSRKNYLIDYLGGFIDIHNHILPGIDDGAKNVEESLALLHAFSEFGVHNFIATPHIMGNYYPNTRETINDSLRLLKNAMETKALDHYKIEVAAEHMIDDKFETILEDNEIMPLRNNHVLVEMSYLQPAINFDEAIIALAIKHYQPILAHPERYVFLSLNSSKFLEFKKKGILFQTNLLSLGEYYGKEVQKKAIKLLNEGLIDFVASDVHNQDQLTSIKKIQLSNKHLELLLPILEKTIYNFY
ncbi:MAG: histidinol phosphatase [Maribacter sp.]|nr:histidinol phosphatase [Maribacter sp.]